MKKRKHERRRLAPHPMAPKPTPASAKSSARGLRQAGWFAGLGLALALLLGFFLSRNHPSPVDSHPASVKPTNAPVIANVSQPDGGFGLGGEPPAGATKKSGEATDKEAENHADELNNMGARLLDAGDAAKAVPIFEKAVALKSEDETFHFNLAVAYAKTGDIKNAEIQYEEALRLLPEYPEAHNNYGNLLARAGRWTEAEEHLRDAVTDEPESAPYNNSLGVLWEHLKKTNDALQCFEKAVECDSNYFEAHFNLAEAYLDRKERDKGIAQLHEALRLKPGFEPAQRALARVMETEPPASPAGEAPK
jgi:Tfp pilus assembly protein PilF